MIQFSAGLAACIGTSIPEEHPSSITRFTCLVSKGLESLLHLVICCSELTFGCIGILRTHAGVVLMNHQLLTLQCPCATCELAPVSAAWQDIRPGMAGAHTPSLGQSFTSSATCFWRPRSLRSGSLCHTSAGSSMWELLPLRRQSISCSKILTICSPNGSVQPSSRLQL